MKRDNSQAVFNILSQLILNGTNFVLIMIFTRFLSTSDYGNVSIFQAYALFFAVIVGLNVQGSIGTAFVHINEKERNNYLASIMFLAICFFIIVSLVVGIFIGPFSSFSELSPFLIILMLCYSFGSFSFNFANIKYVYLRKSQYSCLMAFIISISMIVLSWIGVKNQSSIELEPYILRILSISIPYLICAVFVLVMIFVKGNPFVNIKKYWAFCFPICLPLVFHGISQIVLGQTDKIMIQKLLSDDGLVGIYSFIVTFIHILNSIYTALNNTWVPIYYGYTKNNENKLIIKRSNRYCNLFLCLCLGFMFVSPEFVKIFADKNYWGGIGLIPLIVLAVFFTFLYSFAVNYELYHRKTKWIAVGTTAAALCNIIMNTLLIPRFELFGAAMATLLSYFLLFLFHQICAHKIRKEGDYPYKISFFIKRIVIVLVASALFYFVENLIVIRWCIAVLVGVYLLWTIKKNKTIF